MTLDTSRWAQIKTRFQNNIIGVIVVSAISVGVFLANTLDVWDRLAKRFNPPVSELLLTPLSGPSRPKPLDAYDIVKAGAGSDGIPGADVIYPRGAKITIDIMHNHEEDATITHVVWN